MKLGGFLTGLLVLAGLEVVTSSKGAANRVGAIPTFAAAFVERVISPDLGLIPNFKDQGAQLAHGNALAEATTATTNTRGGGTVITGAGAKVRSAPTSGATGPVGPGI